MFTILQTSFCTLVKRICSASFLFYSFYLHPPHSLILLYTSSVLITPPTPTPTIPPLPFLTSTSSLFLLVLFLILHPNSIPRLNHFSANNHISICHAHCSRFAGRYLARERGGAQLQELEGYRRESAHQERRAVPASVRGVSVISPICDAFYLVLCLVSPSVSFCCSLSVSLSCSVSLS